MDILIFAAARTALGAFGGGLKDVTGVDLGSTVLRALLERSGVEPEQVAEVVLGQVLQAGGGPNGARQAALRAGLSQGTPALTLNQAGGSGLRAVALAARDRVAGTFAIGGGTESMSGSPYLLPGARWGAPIGPVEVVDSVLQDGGVVVEDPLQHPATPPGPGEPALDAWVASSRRKAASADFAREIVPVLRRGRRGESVFAVDEVAPGGRSAPPADGAAAVLLGTGTGGPRPIARLLGFAQAAGDPAAAVPATVQAVRRLLAETGLPLQQVDRWELEEVHAARHLDLLGGLPEVDPERVNVRGGSFALGRPLGASGARILVTLLHILQDQDLRFGVAALDAGDGTGLALAVERL